MAKQNPISIMIIDHTQVNRVKTRLLIEDLEGDIHSIIVNHEEYEIYRKHEDVSIFTGLTAEEKLLIDKGMTNSLWNMLTNYKEDYG